MLIGRQADIPLGGRIDLPALTPGCSLVRFESLSEDDVTWRLNEWIKKQTRKKFGVRKQCAPEWK